jgi:hypothetical protein
MAITQRRAVPRLLQPNERAVQQSRAGSWPSNVIGMPGGGGMREWTAMQVREAAAGRERGPAKPDEREAEIHNDQMSSPERPV